MDNIKKCPLKKKTYYHNVMSCNGSPMTESTLDDFDDCLENKSMAYDETTHKCLICQKGF